MKKGDNMIATFACKNCGYEMDILFSESITFLDSQNIRGLYDSCLNCGIKFSNTNYIVDFADKYLSLQRALPELKFCRLVGDRNNV